METNQDSNYIKQSLRTLPCLLSLNYLPQEQKSQFKEESQAAVVPLILEFAKALKFKNVQNGNSSLTEERDTKIFNQSGSNLLKNQSALNFSKTDSKKHEFYMLQILQFFENFVSYSDLSFVNSFLNFSMIYIGYLPIDIRVIFKEEFNVEDFKKDYLHDSSRQENVLIKILSCLDLIQTVTQHVIQVRQVVVKIKKYALNENLNDVCAYAASMTLDYEFENYFDI